MRKQWMLASTILLSSCAMVHTTALGPTLILKPQIQAGAYSTKTVVNSYTQASINHLILKLYTYDTSEHDQGIQKSIPNAQLGNSITFSNLKANTTYRIKAYAYMTADESQLISTNDANSYTDVTLATDDRPTITSLKVRLLDQAFNGQATASGVVVTNGGYTVGVESMNFITPLGIVSTIAGGSGGTTAGNTDGTGTVASFFDPEYIAVDGSGNLYVADNLNHRIRKINSNGVVTTLAGSIQGYADGTGTAAEFNYPEGLVGDSFGNVFVADGGNNVIRKITSTGVVSTFAGGAGSNLSGYADGTGTAAKFSFLQGLAIDNSGNLYVADENNNMVRKITPGAVVTTLAGGGGTGSADGIGTNATFYIPMGLAVDSHGTVYVADYHNNRLRVITSAGVVTTLAGSTQGYADGTGTAAKFNYLQGVAVDCLGNVYVGDHNNNVIRKITSTGVVSTFAGGAGSNLSGYADGTGTAAKFNQPAGMALDGSGNLYVADYHNNLIRRIQ